MTSITDVLSVHPPPMFLCSAASSRQFFGSCFPEAAQAQLLPFSGNCFLEAAQAQLSPIFRQLFFGACAGAALTIFLQLFTAGCVGAALTNFPAAVSRGCAGAALTNFLAAVFRRLRRRSSHQFFGSCLPEAAQGRWAAGAVLTIFFCVRNTQFGYISGHFGVGGAPPDHLWCTLADQRVFRLNFAGILCTFWHALGCLGAPIFRLDAARGHKGRQKVVKIRASEAQRVQERFSNDARPHLKRVFVMKT